MEPGLCYYIWQGFRELLVWSKGIWCPPDRQGPLPLQHEVGTWWQLLLFLLGVLSETARLTRQLSLGTWREMVMFLFTQESGVRVWACLRKTVKKPQFCKWRVIFTPLSAKTKKSLRAVQWQWHVVNFLLILYFHPASALVLVSYKAFYCGYLVLSFEPILSSD